MFVERKISEAVEFILKNGGCKVQKALWLDSGLSGFSNELDRLTVIPFRKIPHFPRPLLGGQRGVVLFGSLEGEDCIVLEGREYLYNGYFHRELAFPVRVLSALGVRTMSLTAGVCPLHDDWAAGEIALVADHIDFSGGSPLKGLQPGWAGNCPVNPGPLYSPAQLDAAQKIAEHLELTVRRSVAALLSGPAVPTAAEQNMFRGLGVDLFSMTLAAEVAMARYLGMEILALGFLKRKAGGRRSEVGESGWGSAGIGYLKKLFQTL